MLNIKETLVAALLASLSMTLVACNGGSDDTDAEYEAESVVSQEKFDLAQLPADFPRDLIPDEYHSSLYTKLGGIETASFESRTPASQVIDYYTTQLGKPTVDSGAPGPERVVQWQTSPWMLSVVGNQDESLIGFTRKPK